MYNETVLKLANIEHSKFSCIYDKYHNMNIRGAVISTTSKNTTTVSVFAVFYTLKAFYLIAKG